MLDSDKYCMKCKYCKNEMTGKYSKIYCSMSCSTKDYQTRRVGKECPHCKKLLLSCWNAHIAKCKGVKVKTPPKEKKIWRCVICDTVTTRGRACCSDKCVRIRISDTSTGRPITDKQRANGRRAAAMNGSGYKRGSGIGKSGWYKGIWCDSSWELAFLIYCIDNDITISRCKERFSYIFEEKKYNYTPDFVVANDIVEIKGYWTPRNRAKIEQCPVAIKIIDKDNINPYLEYVTMKYGKDYISLYEQGE